MGWIEAEVVSSFDELEFCPLSQLVQVLGKYRISEETTCDSYVALQSFSCSFVTSSTPNLPLLALISVFLIIDLFHPILGSSQVGTKQL